MSATTPTAAMDQLIAALNSGDLDRALAMYVPDATFVAEPDHPAHGRTAIRESMTGFFTTAPRITIEAKQFVEAGDIALCCTRWSLDQTAPDGEPTHTTGHGAVVLRCQPNRSWLVAIENPWAGSVG